MKKTIYIALLLSACATTEYGTSYPGTDFLPRAEIANAIVTPDFDKHIKPILETRCADCHNKKTLPGILNLDDRNAAFTPTSTGHMAIVPYHPEHSPLLTQISAKHRYVRAMPPVGEKVTKNEIAILKQWIAQGAYWPAGKAGALKIKEIPSS